MDMIKSYAKEFKKTEAFGYVSQLSTKVKQMALNLTDLEVKVEEATNNEPWGPHGSAMAGQSLAVPDCFVAMCCIPSSRVWASLHQKVRASATKQTHCECLHPEDAPAQSLSAPSAALHHIGGVLVCRDAEISEAAYDSEGYRQIMGVVARRLQDTGELWRHVYKSLLLLEYMLKHGPQKVGSNLSTPSR
jgi:ENTH domain